MGGQRADMDITLTTHNNKVDTLKWPMTSLIHIHFKVVLQPLALTQFPRRADLFIMRQVLFSLARSACGAGKLVQNPGATINPNLSRGRHRKRDEKRGAATAALVCAFS